jgi:hypothetical protein
MGRTEIAETLSENIVKEILGVFTTYAVASTINNVFRYNNYGGNSTYSEDVKNNKNDNIDC